MLTFYHAPYSRSTLIQTLIHELGDPAEIETRIVAIKRGDGSGHADPANPHPEGKVPVLTDGDHVIRERGAIILYLTDRFPQSGLGRGIDDPQRGPYLSWLFWYQGVLEPVLMIDHAGGLNDELIYSFRDPATAIQQVETALTDAPYLLGQDYSAADLLVASVFAFLGDAVPVPPTVADWVARCQDRPAVRRSNEEDTARMRGV